MHTWLQLLYTLSNIIILIMRSHQNHKSYSSSYENVILTINKCRTYENQVYSLFERNFFTFIRIVVFTNTLSNFTKFVFLHFYHLCFPILHFENIHFSPLNYLNISRHKYHDMCAMNILITKCHK